MSTAKTCGGCSVTLYRIRRWDDLYETYESKRVARMKWLALPVKLDGYGYRRLMQEKDGPAMFGTWCAILQLAARCTPRGTLCSADGAPLPPDEIAVLISIPERLVSKTLEMLSNAQKSKLLWIEALQRKTAGLAEVSAEDAGNCVNVYVDVTVLDHDKLFSEIWSKYPRKIGKSKAFDHFKAQVKTEDDLQLITRALDRFIEGMKVEARTAETIPYGSTWFNRQWRDWADYEPPQLDKPQPVREPGPFKMVCPLCGEKPCRCGSGSTLARGDTDLTSIGDVLGGME